MRRLHTFTALAFAAGLLLGLTAPSAEAQFRAADFEFGDRWALPEGEESPIWNPAMRKLLDGGPMIGGTIRATDARTYCAMAAAGYDFMWVEMQHEATSWEQVARLWRTCPGPAAPGARVAYADEREIQHATDMGAAVIVVPTVDSVEEAQAAVDWTYFPPMGRRSSGGGQGPGRALERRARRLPPDLERQRRAPPDDRDPGGRRGGPRDRADPRRSTGSSRRAATSGTSRATARATPSTRR